MAKDMGGFMKSFAGSLGSQLGGGGLPTMGMMDMLLSPKHNPGSKDSLAEDNPGNKMFGVGLGRPDGNSFLSRFAGGLSDQLFRNAMMGFMGRL